MESIKRILKISIMLALIILLISGIKTFNVSEAYTKGANPTVNGKTFDDIVKLAEWIQSNPRVFARESYSNLLNKEMTGGTGDGVGAINKKNGLCLYHVKASLTDTSQNYYRIVNVVDLDYDASAGKYSITNNGSSRGTDGEDTAKFVYAMYKLFRSSGDISDSKKSDEVFYLFYQLRSKMGISSSFNQDGSWNETGHTGATASSVKSDTKAYAAKVTSYSPISKSTTTPKSSIENSKKDLILGPFKMTYGSDSANSTAIESITATGDGKIISGTIYYATGSSMPAYNSSSWKEFKGSSSSPASLPKNANFYLKIATSSTTVSTYSSVKVTVKQKAMEYYNARFLACQVLVNRNQHTGVFGVAGPNTSGTGGSISWTVSLDGELVISKKDALSNSAVSNVGLKVYYISTDSKTKGWVKGTANATKTYSSTYSGGTEYTTSSGSVTLTGLKAGAYYIYETSTNSNYELEDQRTNTHTDDKDPNGFAGKSAYGNVVYLGTKTVTQGSSVSASYVQKKPARITIKKVDYDTGKKINGANFVVFCEAEGNSSESGWLGYSGGKVTFGNSYSGSHIFISGNSYCGSKVDGQITLAKLRHGRYYVFEIATGSTDYVLSEQPGYSASSNYGILSNSNWKMTKNGSAVPSVLIGATSYNSGYTSVSFADGSKYGFVYKKGSSNVNYVKLDFYNSSTTSGSDIYYGTNDATYTVKNKKKTTPPETPPTNPDPDPELNTSLTVKKVDSSTSTAIPNVQMKLLVKLSENYKKGSTTYNSGTWVWVDSSGNISTGVPTTSFTTNSSGTFTITKIPYGTYYIIETAAANGYNLSEQDGYLQKPSGYTGSMPSNYVNLGSTTVTKTSQIISKQVTNKIVTIEEPEVPNTRLTVRKVDSTTSSVIPNVGMQILVKLSEEFVSGTTTYSSGTWAWVKSDGSITTTTPSTTQFTTNSSGTFTISNIPYGTYYIFETKPGSGYYLSDQSGYMQNPTSYSGSFLTGLYAYLGVQTLTRTSNTATKQVTNEIIEEPEDPPDDQTELDTKLIVFKEDEATSKRISDVEIQVLIKLSDTYTSGTTTYSSGTWVWLQGSGKVSISVPSTAPVKTDSNGRCEISNVPYGTYYLFETKAGSGYELSKQQGYMQNSTGYTANFLTGEWASLGVSVVTKAYSTKIITVKNKGATESKNTKITIEKVDEDSGKAIRSVGIKLLVQLSETVTNGASVYKSGSYAWLLTSGNVTSNANYTSPMFTDSNGIVTLPSVPYGTYYIFETKANSEYNLSEQDGYMQNPSGCTTGFITGEYAYLGSVTITSESEKVTKRVTNKKLTPDIPDEPEVLDTSLTVKKIDKETSSVIPDVGMKVLVKLSEKFVDGSSTYSTGTWAWLLRSGKITINEADAYEFKTGAGGIFAVSNIPYGEYYIFETTPGSGYYLEEQSGYREKPSEYTGNMFTGDYVYLGNTAITRSAGKITKEITNILHEEITAGKLTITKTDRTYKDDLGLGSDLGVGSAEIKIYGTELEGESVTSGWVKQVRQADGSYKYEYTTYANATTFTTDGNGKAELEGVSFGTYYVYETKAPKGYNIKVQPGYHVAAPGSGDLGINIDWVLLGNTKVSKTN